MKSEELFFEDLNFFRFFFCSCKKTLLFFTSFFLFSLFFFSFCLWDEQKTKKDQKQPKNQKDENKNKKKERLFRDLVVSKKLS